MPFTNEQLKWLKENIADTNRKLNPSGIFLDMNEWDALLARLEASERKNRANDSHDDFDCSHESEDQCKCGLVQIELIKECEAAEKAWRKARGEL